MKNTFVGLTVLAAIILGYFANDLLSFVHSKPSITLDSSTCLLSTQPCKDGTVVMFLDNDHTQPLKANQLTVIWPNTNAPQLSLTLYGVEMEMGSVKYHLKSVGADHYISDIILPVCTSTEMTWIGELSDGTHTTSLAIRMQR
jgi:hypothetical protein